MPLQIASLLRPFETFFKSQVSGGLVLLAAAVLALILANSPFGEAYHRFWEIELTIGIGAFGLSKSLHFWINEGLMAVFFFVVGLEIKREFISGELASRRRATLPIAAALGGMVVPALIFVLLNPRPPQVLGWGIPMATDIAFALGIIALLGSRIPRSLAIFLTALAIVDDLGAVLVIAIFYTGDLSLGNLGIAALCLVALVICNRLGLQHPNYYALLGICLWISLLKSGVHASIAGVLIGATIPVLPRYSHPEFLQKTERLLRRHRELGETEGPFLHDERMGTLLAMEKVCHDALSPLQRMEYVMHDWVIYGVMPIFALANAGISLGLADLAAALSSPVTIGVALGLMVGKPFGIFLFSWLAVRLGLCDLPGRSTWPQVLGIGMLGGIGFTMSIFIASLAFADPLPIADAKTGIFAASLLSGIAGYLFLSGYSRRGHAHPQP